MNKGTYKIHRILEYHLSWLQFTSHRYQNGITSHDATTAQNNWLNQCMCCMMATGGHSVYYDCLRDFQKDIMTGVIQTDIIVNRLSERAKIEGILPSGYHVRPDSVAPHNKRVATFFCPLHWERKAKWEPVPSFSGPSRRNRLATSCTLNLKKDRKSVV